MRILKLAFALALFLCGCGGATRHAVETGEQGSLHGLGFIPSDHSLRVETDIDPEIYWSPGYKPPSRFTVSLKRIDEYGDLNPINTKLESSGENRWKLKVFGVLDEGKLYAVIVRDDTRGEEMQAWFMTRKGRVGGGKTSEHAHENAFEHTVTTEAQE
ncbi:MAG: hypothetical protein GDYSWBUE_000569 [Candidatus Fervidibacterota bacterium]